MQHTYLRYECADAFGLVSASASSKIPASNSTLAVATDRRDLPIVLTSAGSHCIGFHLRTTNPTVKIGHREDQTGGVGTGRSLNSDQIVCIDVSPSQNDECRIATGWADGAVRVFTAKYDELNNEKGSGLARSLGSEDEEVDDDCAWREPLVLDGHTGSPIRSIALEPANGTRLASGSSDGAIVLWDVVEECGLFRLLGHRGGVTDVHFVFFESGLLDALVTSSLDGLVKVWDLKGQCCIQTIASHRGKVWTLACLRAESPNGNLLARLVTGDDEGFAKLWSMDVPTLHRRAEQTELAYGGHVAMLGDKSNEERTECCRFMGSLGLPAGIAPSSDHVTSAKFHPNGKYVGVLNANSKSVHVYFMRSRQETQKRMQRRISRRRQKAAGSQKADCNSRSPKDKKRGLLDEEDEEHLEEVSGNASMLLPDPEKIEATDEFEYIGTANASHKIRAFVFVPWKESGSTVCIVCSLATNALETISLRRRNISKIIEAEPASLHSVTISKIDMIGHSTGIRAVELSSDDSLACTVSKNSFKIWSTSRRKCIQSLSSSVNGESFYALCASFLPGNSHLVIGTREGHLLLVDVASGEVILGVDKAHEQAIWSIDIRYPTEMQPSVSVATGSADKTVKFWSIETLEDETPRISHARTLEMTDDVVAVKFSHSTDPSKRMVFVSSMDSTVKVFFEDSLKFFLSLYGHKLPALALDASDDDAILATSGADKLVKIWGLDFGDTHRTLHGHDDSITDLRFVRHTHNFFTSSKDGTLRYWDGDRFEQILVLYGHFAEVSSLAISRTGAFVLSAGMDRQVRVWERTKDIVFLPEERGVELERTFDRIETRTEQATGEILRRNGHEDDDIEEPQSAAAVKQNILSVTAGDRIFAAIELADQELRNVAQAKKINLQNGRANPLLLGMDPTTYILWVLKTVNHAELEQSLLVLPVEHVSRVLYYLVALLRKGQGVELCSRVALFLLRTHQYQIQSNNRNLTRALQELRRLLRLRLEEYRYIVGFNLSGLQAISHNSSQLESMSNGHERDIWAGLALGR